MIVIIDLMGDDETVVVCEDEAQKLEREQQRQQALRDIAERAPQPDLLIVPRT